MLAYGEAIVAGKRTRRDLVTAGLLISRLQCRRNNCFNLSSDDAVPLNYSPLAMDWHDPVPTIDSADLLAVSDEGGWIHVLRYGSPTVSSPQLICRWMANANHAIFDIKWRPNYPNHLACGSGDNKVRLLDVSTRQQISLLEGHSASVKIISFSADLGAPYLLATGGRDGVIRVWDLRVSGTSLCRLELQRSTENHYHPRTPSRSRLTRTPVSTPSPSDRAKSSASTAANTPAVVGLVMLDATTILNCSDRQPGLAIWDLRSQSAFPRSRLQCGHQAVIGSSPGRNSRAFVHIVLDPISRRRCAIISAANCAHIVDPDRETGLDHPILTGASSGGSFYVRADLSPCGSFLASGSSVGVVPIWQINLEPHRQTDFQSPSVLLNADDTSELSSVAWHKYRPGILATASDSAVLRLWEAPGIKRGEADNGLVGVAAIPLSLSVNLWTPAKENHRLSSSTVFAGNAAKRQRMTPGSRLDLSASPSPTKLSSASKSSGLKLTPAAAVKASGSDSRLTPFGTLQQQKGRLRPVTPHARSPLQPNRSSAVADLRRWFPPVGASVAVATATKFESHPPA